MRCYAEDDCGAVEGKKHVAPKKSYPDWDAMAAYEDDR